MANPAFPTTLGQVPSSVWDTGMVNTPPDATYVVGSGAGVPSPDTALEVNAPGNYANRISGAPAHRQPVFWSLLFMVVGILILAHIAHFSLRDVG